MNADFFFCEMIFSGMDKIDDFVSLPARTDQAGGTQNREVMGGLRLHHIEQADNI